MWLSASRNTGISGTPNGSRPSSGISSNTRSTDLLKEGGKVTSGWDASLGEDAVILIERDSRIELIRMNEREGVPAPVIERRFVGPLKGASYREELRLDSRESEHFAVDEVTLILEHPTLPSTLTIAARARHLEQLEPLRSMFRSWVRQA
jgi:hypothetical protein